MWQDENLVLLEVMLKALELRSGMLNHMAGSWLENARLWKAMAAVAQDLWVPSVEGIKSGEVLAMSTGCQQGTGGNNS